MKKLTLLLLMMIVSSAICAQKQVVLKAGTIIPLAASQTVKAADVSEGDMVNFYVLRDVNVDGVCVIPKGTLAKGKVTQARKSSVAGTKGRLTIEISSLLQDNGEPIYFSNTVARFYGKNRTPGVVVATVFVWPLIFIPGSKAVMPEGYEVHATVAANMTISVK